LLPFVVLKELLFLVVNRQNRCRIFSDFIHCQTLSVFFLNKAVPHFRYDPDTDTASITTDRCPYRGQNLDYARYLLTALYHESWRTEEWERKEEPDLEVFKIKEEMPAGEGSYAQSLETILNKGEDENSLRQYKEQTRKLLNLPEFALKPDIVV
jgi:hypothetical protein